MSFWRDVLPCLINMLLFTLSNELVVCVDHLLLLSLEDFEGRMNAAIERNAFLESELDEKVHSNEQ